jgi:hypothetical protein
MALYYLGTVNVWGSPSNPRVTATVRRVSTEARIGNIIVWSGTKFLELPESRSPRRWLEEGLEAWLGPLEQ